MFVCCECCVLSGRGFCDGLITRPEESYRLRCVVVCDQEISKTRRLKPATGLWKIQPQWVVTPGKQTTIIFIVAPCILKIRWVLHTNECTNRISYISLKLYTLKHFHCSYIFR
jgi:hypothetical protein